MRRCEFPNCGRKHYAHGLCEAHSQQQRRGNPLTPLIRREKFPVVDGHKVCSRCRRYTPVEDYYTKTSGILFAWCKSCMIANAAETRARRKAREAAESHTNAA